ncbi:MAG: hypothetical protein WKG00_34735 [Polyangiaceae bacterium]
MKRKPQLTKRERKALSPNKPAPAQSSHIHCITCGAHLEPSEFEPPDPTAMAVRCQHGSTFASCAGCVERTKELLAEHDRTGQPVKTASAWH